MFSFSSPFSFFDKRFRFLKHTLFFLPRSLSPLLPALSPPLFPNAAMQRAVASCSYSRAAAPAAARALGAVAPARSPLRTIPTHAAAAATTSQAPLQRCHHRRRRQQRSLSPLLLASASAPTAEKEPPRNKTVADIMTRGVFTVTADTTVNEGAILRSDF